MSDADPHIRVEQKVVQASATVRNQIASMLGREHARAEHLRFADQVERMGRMPGMPFTSDQAAEAVARLRDLATRFSG